jgi:hypothetical protein
MIRCISGITYSAKQSGLEVSLESDVPVRLSRRKARPYRDQGGSQDYQQSQNEKQEYDIQGN